MTSIGPTRNIPLRAVLPQPAAPSVATASAAPPPTAQMGALSYNWNMANPRDHIFDHPYDGWALNRGLMKLGGVGFWSRYTLTRNIASMITKIPTQRLRTYAVREKFMTVPGMKPDYARVLQLAYFDQTNGQMPLHRQGPLTWLAQYGAPGDLNDWILRGPFLVTLHTASVQYAMNTYHAPLVPNAREIMMFGQHAMMIAPPPFNPAPGQPIGPGQPGTYPGYGGYPAPGGDPISQIGNLIDQIGRMFR
jgi:hypothetical protein